MEKNSNKLIRKHICLILIAIEFFSIIGTTQPYGEIGTPYIKNFSSKEYKGEPYVFGITQDTSKFIYFTGNGVIEYDGETWRKTSFKGTFTWSVVLGNDNRIYIGGTNDLGYLRINALGKHEYVSLLNLIPETQKKFGELRQAISTKDAVYFSSRTTGQLLCYNYNTNSINIWKEIGNISLLGFISNQLYLMVADLGLCGIVDGKITLLVEKEHFGNSDLVSILPFENNQLLLCTKEKGLFLYDNFKVVSFKTEADDLLHTRTYFGKILPDKTILLSIIGHGIIVLNKTGKWLQHLTKEKGLIDNNILSACISESGEVWLGTYNGISKVALVSPISKFTLDNNEKTILPGDVTRYKNKLYVASGNHNGLLYLNKEGATFQTVDNTPLEQAYRLEQSENNLFVAIGGDVYQIGNDSSKKIYQSTNNSKYVFSAYPSKLKKKCVFLAQIGGLGAIIEKNGIWKYVELSDDLFANLGSSIFEEYPVGRLWIGTGSQGIILMDYTIDKYDNLNIKEVRHLKKGLTTLDFKGAGVQIVDGKVTFTGEGGIFTYEKTSKQLVSDKRFPLPISSLDIQSVQLAESLTSDVYAYFSQFNDNMLLGIYRKQNDKTFIFEEGDLQQVSREDLVNVSKLFIESNGVLWIDGGEGLIRFDTKKKVLKNTIFTKIRQVYLNSDSLIFAGHGNPKKTILPYSQNNIHFHYLAPTINITGINQYQTKLDGFDKQWSNGRLKRIRLTPTYQKDLILFEQEEKHQREKIVQKLLILLKYYPRGGVLGGLMLGTLS